MGLPSARQASRGQWLALAAALLGWMFDGLEMGLFPLVARPALRDLLQIAKEDEIGRWFSVATAGFLVGAATGGVLFGWLGDRLGRVRAMMLSVLTYAVFSGLCGLATAAWQIAVLRFISALGMGGEWSLGVALVMEIWPDHSRGVLAGVIGAAGNLGYLLIGTLGLGLSVVLTEMHGWLSWLPESWVERLLAHSGWRLLMLLGAAPALLAFLIQFFVPESERWQHEKQQGTTSHWAARDLLGVCVAALGAAGMIYLWGAQSLSLQVRLAGSALALIVITLGYLYPVLRYLQRLAAGGGSARVAATVGRLLLGACLGGIPLLVTWSAVLWATLWADQLTGGTMPQAKAYTQMCSAFGAVIGTMTGALMGDWLGRRAAYTLLCLGALVSALVFFQLNDHFGPLFLASVFLAGGCTASFYGWLPLYLPELFHTGVRATGQGFSYNFGRVLAAVGVLQTSNLMALFQGSYPQACSVMSLVYVVGLVVIWFAPETRGKPLPE